MRKLLFLLLFIPMLAFATTEADTRAMLNKAMDSLTLTLQPKNLVIETPLTFMQQDFDRWDQIVVQIRAFDGDQITLLLQGVGGIVFEGNKVIRAIQDYQARGHKVIMHVIGPAYSMHAMLVCFADRVTMDEGSSLMFHSAGLDGSFLFGLIHYKASDPDPASKAMVKYMLDACVTKGILTRQNLSWIAQGNDVTIVHEDQTFYKAFSRDPEGPIDVVSQVITTIVALALGLLIIAIIKRI